MKIFLVLLMLGNLYANEKTNSFPQDFLWGVATSAHQIEGNNVDSDWWAFEQIPGKIKHGDVSGDATNHYNLLEEDTKLIKNLGVKLYRFSIEWAKIEPKKGEFNLEVLEHYRREILLLKKHNIISMVTLHHFTLPLWVADRGGWTNPKVVDYFLNYVKKVEKYLGKELGLVVTINEPLVVLAAGYVNGEFAPGIKDRLDLALKGAIHMLKAHAKAYHYLKSRKPSLKIGLAHHLRIFQAKRAWHPFDHIAASQLDQLFNWSFVEVLKTGHYKAKAGKLKVDEMIPEAKGTQDFFGFNYYSRDMVKYDSSSASMMTLNVKEGSATTDMGWEIYPEGMLKLLKDIHKMYPALPIYITENGIADSKDEKRQKFLEDHLRVVHQAIEKEIPVVAYCYWSLLDNFEWAHGFGPRFGLYHVDYENFSRTLRKSGAQYKKIIKANGSILFGN
jgi:beta-glucosidase